MESAESVGVLRERGKDTEVSSIELFFDLVYVLAVTQLTRYLVDSLSSRGWGDPNLAARRVGAWNYTSWFTNYVDPGTRAVRGVLVVLMFASLLMSAWLPQAFGGRGVAFAAAYVGLNVGRTLFAVATLDSKEPLSGVFRRPLVWWTLTGVLWCAVARRWTGAWEREDHYLGARRER